MNTARYNRATRNAFTLVELLVIIAIVVLLFLLQFPAIAGVKGRTKVAQCASNLRQFALATHIYASEYNGKTPAFPGGFWAWDVPSGVGDFLTRYGAGWRVLYCPGTSPRFTDADNFQLYNYSPGYRVLGYATTFPGTSINASNINSTVTPQPIPVGVGVSRTPLASERVLLADATISPQGSVNEEARYTYNYDAISGGTPLVHTSAHLAGRFPLGGNLAMLDGHVEWRDFDDMHVRTSGATLTFWW